jgi:hypothetical protein
MLRTVLASATMFTVVRGRNERRVALAATQKAVLSYVVGKRDTANTEALALDLRARILNHPQITSDSYKL